MITNWKSYVAIYGGLSRAARFDLETSRLDYNFKPFISKEWSNLHPIVSLKMYQDCIYGAYMECIYGVFDCVIHLFVK